MVGRPEIDGNRWISIQMPIGIAPLGPIDQITILRATNAEEVNRDETADN